MKQKDKKKIPNKEIQKKGNIDDPCSEKIIECLSYIWGNSFTYKYNNCNKKKKKEVIKSMQNFFEEKRTEIFQKMDEKKEIKNLEKEEEKKKDININFEFFEDSIIEDSQLFINKINDSDKNVKNKNGKKEE